MAILDEIRQPPFEQLLSWHPVDNTLIDLRQGDVNFLNINSPLTRITRQFNLNKAILLKHSMFVYKLSCSAEMGVRKSEKKAKQQRKGGAGILTDGNFTLRFKYSQSTS